MSIGLLGQKIGMTSVYDANGRMRPVTVIAAGDNVLLRRVTAEHDGYSAIKVGFGAQKESRVTKALFTRDGSKLFLGETLGQLKPDNGQVPDFGRIACYSVEFPAEAPRP